MKYLLLLTFFIHCSQASANLVSITPHEVGILIPEEILEAMDITPEMAARIRGGDIVGNGGGQAEQEFRFSLRRIPSIISDCLESRQCPVTKPQEEMLLKLKKLSHLNMEKSENLIFLSEKKYPGFFRGKNDPEIRIAKTALFEGAPIFINLDLIYHNSEIALSFPQIVSILIHELGHQTGEKSHSYLDDLGARIRDFVSQDLRKLSINVRKNNLRVTILNFKSPNKASELTLRLTGKFIDTKKHLIEKIRCDRSTEIVIGYMITNPHWDRIIETGNKLIAPLRTWISIQCLDLQNQSIKSQNHDLRMNIVFQKWDNTFSHLEVEVE